MMSVSENGFLSPKKQSNVSQLMFSPSPMSKLSASFKGVQISDSVIHSKPLESPYQTPQRNFTDPFASIGSSSTRLRFKSCSSIDLFAPTPNQQQQEKQSSHQTHQIEFPNESKPSFSIQRSPLNSNFNDENQQQTQILLSPTTGSLHSNGSSSGNLSRKRKMPTPLQTQQISLDGHKQSKRSMTLSSLTNANHPTSSFNFSMSQSADSINTVTSPNEKQHNWKHASMQIIRESLVADCVLPTIRGSHPDLNCIDASTVVELISGKHKEKFDEIFILDCRFPYEFEGGHVRNAKNVTENELEKMFIEKPNLTKRIAIVFYCEFSSQRGPNCYRRLRAMDRQANLAHYPQLFYNDVYLLEGGYKNFYTRFDDFCDPKAYVLMRDKRYVENMRENLKSRGKRSRSVSHISSGCSSSSSNTEITVSMLSMSQNTPMKPSLKFCDENSDPQAHNQHHCEQSQIII